MGVVRKMRFAILSVAIGVIIALFALANPQYAHASSMQGIDVSHHNSGLDISVTDSDFAIIKATQGTRYRYGITSTFASQTVSSGKELGFYHYAEGRDPIAEADYFVQEVKDYLPHALLVLDWEKKDNQSFGSRGANAWVKAFRDEVKRQSGVDCIVYGSVGEGVLSLDVSRHYLWVARYASNNVTGWQLMPWRDGEYSDCALRQYTSTGRVANYSGDLDLNKFYGTKLDWRVYELSNAGDTAAGSTFTGDPNAYRSGWALVNGEWRYYRDGAAVSGWLRAGSNWYYLDPSTKSMRTGWVSVDGRWYFFDASGAMRTGWIENASSWYYFDGSGAMATGWLNLNGTWYYLDPSSGAMRSGWIDVGGHRYYLYDSGAMATGWLSLAGAWYHLDGSGALQTGWISLGGAWYYLNPSGGAMATGWLQDNGTWYFLDGSGAMATGWRYVNGSWYWFWGSGAMQGPGWARVNGAWYYFLGYGGMATGWVNDGGTWYYLNDSGSMHTGWLRSGDSWYFLHSDGSMAVGWLKDGGAWYYLSDNGSMAVGWLTLGDTAYYLGESGALEKSEKAAMQVASGVSPKVNTFAGSDGASEQVAIAEPVSTVESAGAVWSSVASSDD